MATGPDHPLSARRYPVSGNKGYHNRNPIRRHGETPAAHFTIIPNELARDTDLSMHAYRAAIVIRTHADGYELSSVSLAESQGWGRARTRAALRELVEAHWLVIRPYKTANGKRAFEEYHVHAARKFTPQESATLAEPVILSSPSLAQTKPLVPCEPTPWPGSDQPAGLAQATKEDYLEDQEEDQKEDYEPSFDYARDMQDDEPSWGDEPGRWIDDEPPWDAPTVASGPHPFQANIIDTNDTRCHAPECTHAPILNCRWCPAHVHLAVAAAS